MMRWAFGFLIAFLMAPTAWAQSCAIPATLPEPKRETAPAGEARITQVTGHILALSWSPQFCKTHSGPRFASQCGSQSFGFILHGLWPDGAGSANPQWCKLVGTVPADVARKSFCATPSVDLQQHEWAKHGSCVAEDAATYFRNGTTLFAAIQQPDMDRLSRARPSVGEFTTAFIAANRGLRADMIRVTIGKGGWLEEVRLCLDKSYHAVRCPRDIGGANPRTALKIWRAVK